MPIQTQSFGTFEGQEIHQFTLTNSSGMEVRLINYGATITSISLPGKKEEKIEIVCGFDTFAEYFQPEYLQNAPYFGCTVGRYASRIKDGTFHIAGKKYSVAINDGSNHLHGGIQGFDKRAWNAETQAQEGFQSVKMTLASKHLEEGYPGNVEMSVIFSLTNKNEIIIQYEGITDHTTPLSLTNHTYFNLSGFSETIKDHRAIIHSNSFLKPDETNVPIGEIEQVAGSSSDLRSEKKLGECFEDLETGFEHYYVFNKPMDQLAEVAVFTEPGSNRKLTILTTEPGALFYTGYFTSNRLQRRPGNTFGQFRGFCFETSRYPNGPNIPDSPGSLTQPGETYKSTTIFQLENEA